MAIRVVRPGERMKRFQRTPNFPVSGIMKPFGLYPIMVHPVLPGESLKSFRLKWRVLSKPVKHPLVGSWLENWLFYIKLTDLDRELGNMFIDDTYSTSGYLATADSQRYFTADTTINWVQLCMEKFHDSYFLDQDETARTIDGVRKTKLSALSWMQNMMFKPADDALDTTDVQDAYREMDAFMMMQQMNMSELTYEKYLETYGVSSIRQELGKPEILRYARSWTLPVNTVEPTTGTPSSAWVWNDEIQADKDKYFKEPGFIICCGAVRPKMYNFLQKFSLIGDLWGFSDWFPSYNLQDPTAGIKTISTDNPLFHASHRVDTPAADLLYDHRDLLSHGEQFVNNWTQLPYSLPTHTGMTANDADTNSTLRGEYPTDTNVDDMFVSATSTDKFCYYEGIARAVIAGHVTDTTGGGNVG